LSHDDVHLADALDGRVDLVAGFEEPAPVDPGRPGRGAGEQHVARGAIPKCGHVALVLGAIPKCGHVALVLDCCYVNICVIFSSSGSLRMRLISQFSRASGARFSETDDSPETVVGRWILPAKLKALLGSSTLLSQVVPDKDFMAESKSPLFGIAPIFGQAPSRNLPPNLTLLWRLHQDCS